MRFLNLLVGIEIQIIVLLHISAIGPKLLLLSIFLTDIIRIVIYHLYRLVVHHLHFIGHSIQLVLYLGHIVVYVVLPLVLFLLVIHVVYFFQHLLLICLFEVFLLVLFFFVELLE